MLRKIMCDTPLLLCLLTIFATIPANRCEECLETEEASTAEASDKTVSLKTEESTVAQQTEKDDCLETEEANVPIKNSYSSAETEKITPAPNIFLKNELIEKLNTFSNQLYYNLKEEKEGRADNFIIFPFHVYRQLFMLAHVARGNTQTEILNSLKLGIDDVKNATYFVLQNLGMCTSNMCLFMFLKNYVNNRFIPKQEVRNHDWLNLELHDIEYCDAIKGGNKINNDFASIVGDEIGPIINPGDTHFNTRMTILQQFLFPHDLIKLPFLKSNTIEANFFAKGYGNYIIQVDMMVLENSFLHKSRADLKASIIEIPFLSFGLVMLVVLPHEIDGLKDVEEKLKTLSLEDLRTGLVNDSVKVHLPRFTITNTIYMENLLKTMGIDSMFSLAAEFKDTSHSELTVSLFKQKLAFEVREMDGEPSSYVPTKDAHIFKVDRPFHFKIFKSFKESQPLIFLAGNVYDIERCI